MINGTTDELLTVKTELKMHDRLLHTFDKKVDRLEQAYEHQHETLEEIKDNIKEVIETVNEIKDSFNKSKGVAEFKLKLWHLCCFVGGSLFTLASSPLYAEIKQVIGKLHGN